LFSGAQIQVAERSRSGRRQVATARAHTAFPPPGDRRASIGLDRTSYRMLRIVHSASPPPRITEPSGRASEPGETLRSRRALTAHEEGEPAAVDEHHDLKDQALPVKSEKLIRPVLEDL